jgi:hypothetical protein
MGGGGEGPAYIGEDNYDGYTGYYGDDGAGQAAIEDPRLKRRGLAEIIGTHRFGGSGLSALFIEH